MANSSASNTNAGPSVGLTALFGIVGAVLAAVSIALRPDLPADTHDALAIVTREPAWPFVHLGVILGTILVLFGLRGATSQLQGSLPRSLAELAMLSAIVGAAMLTTSAGIAGYATLAAARAWQDAGGATDSPDLMLGHVALLMNNGLTYIWMSLLLGLPAILVGIGLTLGRHSFLVGPFGVVAGVLVLVMAISNFALSNPALEPASRLAAGAGFLWYFFASVSSLAATRSEGEHPITRLGKSFKLGAAVVDTGLRIALLGVVGLCGWVFGSFYPMPQDVLARVSPQLIEARVRELRDRAVTTAVAAGRLIVVERVAPQEDVETPDVAMAGAAPLPAAAVANEALPFETALSICPGMTVSNAPAADASLHVINYAPVVNADGVTLAVNPTHGACLSSGFGPRGQRTHRGVDYYSGTGGPILAAADGTIIEMKYRDDFGNMLLIDHGHGVYTRYAHLSSFKNDLAVGSHVRAGELIGLMGNTASFPLPIHLHYEVLTGDYNNPRGSFGLQPTSPFSYPPAGG